MTIHLMTPEIKGRPIDVTSIENALVDMLVRGTEADLSKLQLVKGTMKLVDTHEQKQVLGQVGALCPEIEVGGSAANVLRALAVLGAAQVIVRWSVKTTTAKPLPTASNIFQSKADSCSKRAKQAPASLWLPKTGSEP